MKRFVAQQEKRHSPLIALVLFAIVVIFLLQGAASVSKLSESERLRTAEQAVRRAAAQCYAVEGIYPPDLDYMQEHYGLRVDLERYVVDYRCFASNLMPDITVLPRT